MRTGLFRSRALGAGLLLFAALTVACSAGDPSSPEAAASPPAAPVVETREPVAATPATANTPPAVTASPGPTLAEIRAVALMGAPEVLEAVERGDVEALLGLTFRHLGFCGWPLRDADAPIAPEDAYRASNACNPDVTYRGIEFGGYSFVGGLEVGGGLWTEDALRRLLRSAFGVYSEQRSVEARLRDVEVLRYRRVLADGTVVDQERYTLAFEFIGATGIDGEDRARQLVAVNGIAFEVESGENLPITRLAFLHRGGPFSPRLTEHAPSPPRVREDVGPSVRATLADINGVSDVVEAVASGDVDALLALFETQTLNCAHPPLPGKEIPEVCELIGSPPGDRYESVIDTMSGLLNFVSVDRARFILGALFDEGAPVLESAWRAEREWHDTAEPRERYLLAFAGPAVSVAPRRDTLGYSFGWDSFLLLVEPRAERPIIWYSLHNADWPPISGVGQLTRSGDPAATRVR